MTNEPTNPVMRLCGEGDRRCPACSDLDPDGSGCGSFYSHTPPAADHARLTEVFPVSRALFDEDPAAYDPHDHHARLAAERCADGGELCTNPACPCRARLAAGTEEG